MITLTWGHLSFHSLSTVSYGINHFNACHQYSLKLNRPLVRRLIPWWNCINIHTSALLWIEPYVDMRGEKQGASADTLARQIRCYPGNELLLNNL